MDDGSNPTEEVIPIEFELEESEQTDICGPACVCKDTID